MDCSSGQTDLMIREHFRVFSVSRLFFIHLKIENSSMWARVFQEEKGLLRFKNN